METLALTRLLEQAAQVAESIECGDEVDDRIVCDRDALFGTHATEIVATLKMFAASAPDDGDVQQASRKLLATLEAACHK